MKTIKKEHQILLVHTDESKFCGVTSFILDKKGITNYYLKSNDKDAFTYEKTEDNNVIMQPFYLYILSDEEIKEGDIVQAPCSIGKVKELHWKLGNDKPSYIIEDIIIISLRYGQKENQLQTNSFRADDCKKIIATTNPELTADYLPFQEAYTGIPPKKTKVSFPNKNKLPEPTDEFIQQWIAKDCPEKINVSYWIIPFSKVAPDRDRTGDPKLAVSDNNTITCSFIEEKSLDSFLRGKLDENEKMLDFAVATETVRCWIDEWFEQNKKK